MNEATEPSNLIQRHALPLVNEMLSESPVVVIQGARQVGKSTLIQMVMAQRGGQVLSLDQTTTRETALAHPDEFVTQVNAGHTLALDEVQRVPQLMRAIKAAVDDDRRPGRFLLTGSADLLHVSGSNESLAGRSETLDLWGLSQGEKLGRRDDFVTWLSQGVPSRRRSLEPCDYTSMIVAGGYPEAGRRQARAAGRWFDGYLRSVTDHDAAEVSGLARLNRLQVLLRWLAAQTSHELVLASASRATGVPERSLPPYLRLLDDLYLTRSLPAWGRNLAKRVVGRPKAVVVDTGLAAHLTGATVPTLADLQQRPRLGDLLETFVASELIKQQTWSETPYRLFHFRDAGSGSEVDLVVELADGRAIGIGVKASVTLGRSDFAGLTALRDSLGTGFVAGVVFYTGTEEIPWGDRLRALPVSALWQATDSQ